MEVDRYFINHNKKDNNCKLKQYTGRLPEWMTGTIIMAFVIRLNPEYTLPWTAQFQCPSNLKWSVAIKQYVV